MKFLSKLMLFTFVCTYGNHVSIAGPHPRFNTTKVFIGALQFPQALHTTPEVRMYYAGEILQCQVDAERKKALFDLTTLHNTTQFHLLITEKIEKKSLESNTLDSFMIPADTNYTFYELELVTTSSTGDDNKIYYSHNWEITEKKLEEQEPLPDTTITVFYDPDYVEGLQGGSSFELPTIMIRSDIPTLELTNKANELLLSALDTDIFHAKTHPHRKCDASNKVTTILMCNS